MFCWGEKKSSPRHIDHWLSTRSLGDLEDDGRGCHARATWAVQAKTRRARPRLSPPQSPSYPHRLCRHTHHQSHLHEIKLWLCGVHRCRQGTRQASEAWCAGVGSRVPLPGGRARGLQRSGVGVHQAARGGHNVCRGECWDQHEVTQWGW